MSSDYVLPTGKTKSIIAHCSLKKKPYQTSDKPGSVVEQSFILICRCRHILSDLPEHATGRSIVFCLVLLPMGFSLPRPLPCVRCALTTPFHPYPQGAVCFLCHFPSSCDAYPLDSIVPCEARTFLPIHKNTATACLSHKA